MPHRTTVVPAILAGLLCLAAIACGDAAGDLARARVTVNGLHTVIDIVEFQLEPGDYRFDVTAEGNAVATTIDIQAIRDADEVVVHEVTFTRSNGDTGASEGDTGFGSSGVVTLTAASVANVTVTVNFEGDTPEGAAVVDVSFSHAPDIRDWSFAPASPVRSGEVVRVTADVAHHEGTTTTRSVVTELLDSGGSPVPGAGAVLGASGGLWVGTFTAPVVGSTTDYTLRLTADDGVGGVTIDTSSPFAVQP